MKLYVCHSTDWHYQGGLYAPLRSSPLNEKHQIILPHEDGELKDSKETIMWADVVLAELSYASTGQGIELGWADAYGVPILGFYAKDREALVSKSALLVLESVFSYQNSRELISCLAKLLESVERQYYPAVF